MSDTGNVSSPLSYRKEAYCSHGAMSPCERRTDAPTERGGYSAGCSCADAMCPRQSRRSPPATRRAETFPAALCCSENPSSRPSNAPASTASPDPRFPIPGRRAGNAAGSIPISPPARAKRALARRKIMFHLAENPGRTHRRPADHGAGDSGFGPAPDESAPLVRSPLPMTGIDTADTTSPITFQSASPE